MADIIKTLNPLISELVGNYNALSAEQLDDWMRTGKVSHQDLARVLPDQMLADYEHHPYQIMLPAGAGLELLREAQKEYTEVYVWGRKGAGKSAVIGSILAAQPQSLEQENQGAALTRAQHLVECYAETGNLVSLPEEEELKIPAPQVTCIELHGHEHRFLPNQGHPLALIECPGQVDTLLIDATGVKRSKHEQIHILCWDSTYDKGDVQEQMFLRLLRDLRRCKALEHTVGIYLLVTKVDRLMVLDLKYYEQIAQQIITAEHQQLWAEVKNLCWDMDIHDATPIPFSIGEVFLQQLVRIDLRYARELIEGPLLLKSQRNRSQLETVMMKGSLGLSIVLIALMATGLGYGIYSAFASLSEPPRQVITIPDYHTYFIEQVETKVKDQPYKSAHFSYSKLYDNLELEHSILTQDGTKLLPDSVWKPCQSALLESFAPILHKRNRQEMEKHNWETSDGMGTLLECNRSILRKSGLTRIDRRLLQEDLDIFEQYNLACRRIKLSRKCQSMADVDSVLWANRNLLIAPLTNNDFVREGLQQAPETAKLSYANHLAERVDLFIASRQECMKLRTQLHELRYKTTDQEPARLIIDQALRKIQVRYPVSHQNNDPEQTLRNIWHRTKRALGI